MANKLTHLLIGGVPVIGIVNAAKLLGVHPVNICGAIKNGHKCKGFVIEKAPNIPERGYQLIG